MLEQQKNAKSVVENQISSNGFSPVSYGAQRKITIAVGGAGWYGTEIAADIKKQFSSVGAVDLYEKEKEMFRGTSGTFDARISLLHYLGSVLNRDVIREDAVDFVKKYPGIVKEEDAYFALSKTDVTGQPSRTSLDNFYKVSKDLGATLLSPEDETHGFKSSEVLAVAKTTEHIIKLGSPLRKERFKLILDAKVNLFCNTPILAVKQRGSTVAISIANKIKMYDYFINTTSFGALVDANKVLPPNIAIVYQVCIALQYEDLSPEKGPLSKTLMDGLLPQTIPQDAESADDNIRYNMATHARWTTIASCETKEEAEQHLKWLKEHKDAIIKVIEPSTRNGLGSRLPEFFTRFKYTGVWLGVVHPKIRSGSEVRVAITTMVGREIFVFPGKVPNVISVSKEVQQIIFGDAGNLLTASNGVKYLRGGVLDRALKNELAKGDTADPRASCNTQGNSYVLDMLFKLYKHTKPQKRQFLPMIEGVPPKILPPLHQPLNLSNLNILYQILNGVSEENLAAFVSALMAQQHKVMFFQEEKLPDGGRLRLQFGFQYFPANQNLKISSNKENSVPSSDVASPSSRRIVDQHGGKDACSVSSGKITLKRNNKKSDFTGLHFHITSDYIITLVKALKVVEYITLPVVILQLNSYYTKNDNFSFYSMIGAALILTVATFLHVTLVACCYNKNDSTVDESISETQPHRDSMRINTPIFDKSGGFFQRLQLDQENSDGENIYSPYHSSKAIGF